MTEQLFRHYLEGEDDAGYYKMNTLAFYYEELAKKKIELDQLVKRVAGHDAVMAERLREWDGRIETFPVEVTALLEEWVEDGTLNHVIDTALIEQKTAVLTASIEKTAKKTEGVMSVKENGAKGDWNGTTGTDDTANIQSLINTMVEGQTLFFPPSEKGYRTTSTLTIPKGVHVNMESPIIYDGINGQPALVIGNPGVSNFKVTLKLNVSRRVLSDWVNENDIGIKLINADTSKIHIVNTDRFTIGVQFMGDAKGFAYNEITLGYLINNKYAVDLNNVNNGWANENNLYGGRFSVNTGVNRDKDRFGVIIRGSYENNNNNFFLKPSFELNHSNVIAPATSIPVIIENGVQNEFRSCRSENSGSVFVRTLNNSRENVFDIGYGLGVIDEKSLYPTNTIRTRRQAVYSGKNTIYQSKALHKQAIAYDATRTNVAGVFHVTASNASLFTSLTSITPNTSYLELGTPGRGIGVVVSTELIKSFIVKREVLPANPGRVYVKCFDEFGQQLLNDTIGQPYAMGEFATKLSYTTSFGGSYGIGVDSAKDVFVKVRPEVKTVQVIVAAGSIPARIKGFSVVTDEEGTASVWNGFDEFNNDNIALTPPATGTHLQGKRILNGNPLPGAYTGWICTASGTPGTWKGFGLIES